MPYRQPRRQSPLPPQSDQAQPHLLLPSLVTVTRLAPVHRHLSPVWNFVSLLALPASFYQGPCGLGGGMDRPRQP